MRVTSTASTQTGVINILQRTVRRSATGHPVPKQCYCITQRSPRASSLHDGTHTPTRTWHSPWAVAATQSQNDTSLIDSPGKTIGRLSSKCHRWFSRLLVNQLRDGTSRKLTGSYSPQRLREENQLLPSPARAPAGHHQGRHRHNGNSATP